MSKSTKRIKPFEKQQQIKLEDSAIKKEKLPYPYVHYPSSGGAFFAFSKWKYSKPYLCLCSKTAFLNFFKFYDRSSPITYMNQIVADSYDSYNQAQSDDLPDWLEIIDQTKYKKESQILLDINSQFPTKVAGLLKKHLLNSKDGKVSFEIEFKEKLCHKCNHAVPYYLGGGSGNFELHFGRYINQSSYKLGISYYYYSILTEEVPEEIKNKVLKWYDLIRQGEIKRESSVRNEIKSYIENYTREEFGYIKIGEGNISETILTKIIQKIYPNLVVIRHYRPDWLKGLELDIWLPEMRMGIEYQGQQHFHPVDLWGGRRRFVKTKKKR